MPGNKPIPEGAKRVGAKAGQIERRRQAINKSATIPFIASKAITLKGNADPRLRGVVISTNMLDSIGKYAARSNTPMKIATGLASQESTFGSQKGGDYGKTFKEQGYYPATRLVSGWNYVTDNPWSDALSYAQKTTKNVDDMYQKIADGESYANRQGKNFNAEIHPLEWAFNKFKTGTYNTGDPNHTSDVNKAGNGVMNDDVFKQYWAKEGQSWYNKNKKALGGYSKMKKPKAFWGAVAPALISAAGSLASSLIGSHAQKSAADKQYLMNVVQNTNNEAQSLTEAMSNSTDANKDYNNMFKKAYAAGGNIPIEKGGKAIQLNDNLYLLRGRSHKSGGVDIATPDGGIEAEGGEIVQTMPGQMRIFSKHKMGGVSPVEMIMSGYTPNQAFNYQENYKTMRGLNDDGTRRKLACGGKRKYANGGMPNVGVKNYYKNLTDDIINNWNKFGSNREERFANRFGYTVVNDNNKSNSNLIKTSNDSSFAGTNKNNNVNSGISSNKNSRKKSISDDTAISSANSEKNDFADGNTSSNSIPDLLNKFTAFEQDPAYKASSYLQDNTAANVLKQNEFVPTPSSSGNFKGHTIKSNDSIIPSILTGGIVLGGIGAGTYGAYKYNKYANAYAEDYAKRPEVYDRLNKIKEASSKAKNARPVKILGQFNNKNVTLPQNVAANSKPLVAPNNTKPVTILNQLNGNPSETSSGRPVRVLNQSNKPLTETTSSKPIKILGNVKNSLNTSNATSKINNIVSKLKQIPTSKAATNISNYAKRVKGVAGNYLSKIGKGAGMVAPMFEVFRDAPDMYYDDIATQTKRKASSMYKLSGVRKAELGTYWKPNQLHNVIPFGTMGSYDATTGTVLPANYTGLNSVRTVNSINAPITKMDINNAKTITPVLKNTIDPIKNLDVKYKSNGWNWNDTANAVLGIGASIGSALIGANTYKNMKIAGAPVQYSAGNLKKTVSVNPQISATERSLGRLNSLVTNNTGSSVAALSRIGTNEQNANATINSLYGNKENQETALINQDILNQQSVRRDNAMMYNDWLQKSADMQNERTLGIANSYIQGIGSLAEVGRDLINTRNRRYADDQNLRAILATSEQGTPARLAEMGYDFSTSQIQTLLKDPTLPEDTRQLYENILEGRKVTRKIKSTRRL